MSKSSRRIGVPAVNWRRAVTGLAIVAALFGFGAAPALAQGAPVAQVAGTALADTQAAQGHLIGSWAATVNATGYPTVYPTLTFNANGTVALVAQYNAYTGSGAWQGNPNGAFTFTITHPALDSNGNVVGTVHGTQSGTVCGDTFTSSGTSYLYDLSGNLAGTSTVTIAATKLDS